MNRRDSASAQALIGLVAARLGLAQLPKPERAKLRDLLGVLQAVAQYARQMRRRDMGRYADSAVVCDSCDWCGLRSEGKGIRHVEQRTEPAGEVPACACPECGSLCYVFDGLRSQLPTRLTKALDAQRMARYVYN